MTSFSLSPAFDAGLFSSTWVTSTPESSLSFRAFARSAVTSPRPTPIQPRFDMPRVITVCPRGALGGAGGTRAGVWALPGKINAAALSQSIRIVFHDILFLLPLSSLDLNPPAPVDQSQDRT